MKKIFITLFLILSIVSPFLLALFSFPTLSPSTLFTDNQDSLIFFSLRLPRYTLAFFVGAALSLAGVSFQSLLKNPLADPYILGISGGSALGYVIAIILSAPFFLLPFAAFVSALLSLIFIYTIAKTRGSLVTINLLLTGIIFNSFSFAVILVLNAVVPFGQSQQILYLLMGSIPPVATNQLLLIALIVVVCFVILLTRANVLNLFSLGEEEAFHLGVPVAREKKIIFVVTSLLVGASVSLCGLIGFVGLFVPHLLRLFLGADHKILIPASIFFGGLFLSIAEFLASHFFLFENFQTRLPVGAITALIGAPLFVLLLKRQARILC